ncbi:MAG: hypothetical protein JRN15_03940 [Nitrososphaerota archaeon]|nr:hypothetical protein [Nitrososphaerota archaeon]
MIATVILVLIVVSASAVIFTLASNGLESFGAGFSNLLSNQGDAVAQQFSVEQATFNLTQGLPAYVVETFQNTQTSPTSTPFQQELVINPSLYSSQEASDLGNVRFFTTLSGGTFSGPVDSWLEYVSGTPASSATSAIFWLLLANGIPASSSVNIYMVFEPTSTEFDGAVAGEAPQLSASYGQYDNGANIFTYYNVAPTTTTGWTIAGTAGQTGSSPLGSYFGSQDAYYANSANGNYMYTPVTNLGTNEILTFWTYTTGLGNVFFLTNSAGSGQMGRLDSRGGADWSGLATTSSWTSWTAPVSGLDEPANRWLKYEIVISGSSAVAYIGPSSSNLASLGTQANTLSISNNGNYIGLVGDALGSSFITYWNGFVVRYDPPNGVMPTQSSGSIIVPPQAGADIYVRNTGSVLLTMASVYIENVTSSTLVSAYQLNPPITIQPGSFVKIPIVFVPDVGDTYEFTAVSTLGVSESGTFIG